MKRNRILALAVALLLAVQLLVPLACAAGATVTVTAPDKLPAVGETFTISVDLSGNTGLSAVQMKLAYDDSVVECTGVKNGDLLSGMLSASNPHGTRGGVGALIAAAATNAANADGTIVTFTFTVKAAGDAKLILTQGTLTGADGADLPVSYTLPSLVTKSAYSASTGSGSTGSDSAKPSEDEKKDDEKTDDEKKDEPDAEPAQTGTFTDVTSAHWAFASVERAAELGIVTGYSDGTFQPDAPVTRAQFVLMLWRLCGKPAATKAASFADATASWYQDALSWAVENGYVNGLSDTRFGPDAPITRQQATAILFRLNGGQSGAELMLSGIYDQTFSDSASIASWAKDALWWAVYHELVSGVGGSRIAPEANAPRAQIAAILLRYADKFMTMEEAA